MTAFWRTISAERLRASGPVVERRTEGRTMVLWCRCELCKWSGPSTRFTLFEKADRVETICDHAWCGGKPEVLAELEADGWQRR